MANCAIVGINWGDEGKGSKACFSGIIFIAS